MVLRCCTTICWICFYMICWFWFNFVCYQFALLSLLYFIPLILNNSCCFFFLNTLMYIDYNKSSEKFVGLGTAGITSCLIGSDIEFFSNRFTCFVLVVLVHLAKYHLQLLLLLVEDRILGSFYQNLSEGCCLMEQQNCWSLLPDYEIKKC